jgi:hypothetical protein
LEIAAVEAELGVRFPEQLRYLYIECNGFREDRGYAAYLFPLRGDDPGGSLLVITRFFWNDWKSYYPNLDFRPYIFFGSASDDEKWAIGLQDPAQLIAYDHHMQDAFDVVGRNIVEVYKSDYAKYDDLPDGR